MRPILKIAISLFITSFSLINISITNAQNYQWAKGISGYGFLGGITSYCITVDESGNSYTVGYFSQVVDFDPDSGIYNLPASNFGGLFIMKLDSIGSLVWVKSIEGGNGSAARSVILDNDDNLLVTGFYDSMKDFDPDSGIFYLDSQGSTDVFILKLNNNGQFIWAKSMGGSHGEDGRVIQLDAAGNIYTSGSFNLTADFDPGPGIFNLVSGGSHDVFISKLDSNGNFIWAKQFSGLDYDYANDLKVDNFGNCYISGSFKDSVDFDPGPGSFYLDASGGPDAFVSKLDSFGNFLWAINLGGSGVCESKSIAIDQLGMIYISGYFRNACDFDPGPLNYILIPYDSSDIFVCKINNNGDFNWVKQFGGIGLEVCFDLLVDSVPNVYFTGGFTNIADFDPGPGVNNLTTLGNGDIFMGALDSSGVPLWIRQFGGVNSDHGESICTNHQGSLFITGDFRNDADFNYPLNNILSEDSTANSSMFVARYDPSLLGIQSPEFFDEIEIFPNPIFAGQNIIINSNSQFLNVELYNSLGTQIRKLSKIFPGISEISTIDLAPGMYFAKFVREEKVVTKKILILH